MPTTKRPMTKTVIKKVSPNVKVIVPGSKPKTQSATEKAKIAAKAKTKTPAARSADAARAAIAKRNATLDSRNFRNDLSNRAYREALTAAGYNPAKFSEKPTAAQTKAANKAVAAVEVKIKAAKVARVKAAKVERAAASGRGSRGGRGGGLGGVLGMKIR